MIIKTTVKSGNKVKVISSNLPPFQGLCLRVTGDRILIRNQKLGIVKEFPFYENSPFQFEILSPTRLRKSRPYFIQSITSKKLRNKWIRKK